MALVIETRNQSDSWVEVRENKWGDLRESLAAARGPICRRLAGTETEVKNDQSQVNSREMEQPLSGAAEGNEERWLRRGHTGREQGRDHGQSPTFQWWAWLTFVKGWAPDCLFVLDDLVTQWVNVSTETQPCRGDHKGGAPVQSCWTTGGQVKQTPRCSKPW